MQRAGASVDLAWLRDTTDLAYRSNTTCLDVMRTPNYFNAIFVGDSLFTIGHRDSWIDHPTLVVILVGDAARVGIALRTWNLSAISSHAASACRRRNCQKRYVKQDNEEDA
jgi:hypothetical protein